LPQAERLRDANFRFWTTRGAQTIFGNLRAIDPKRLNAIARGNDRYRICFVWHESEPHEVELVDYH
jgi:plasmid maintenance system killer protein